MKNTFLTIASFFVLLFVYTKLVGPIPFAVNSISTVKTDVFSVTGEGKVHVVPDIAVVSVGVNAQGQTAKSAQESLNKNINQVASGIKGLGISDRDIQTTNYALNPTYNYEQNPPKITGYQANSTLVIKVRDIDKANGVLDTATQNGANTVGGITFDVSDKQKAYNQARTEAVAEAKAKASQAAKIAGFTLGQIVNYDESTNAYSPAPIMMANETAGRAKDTTQVEPGTNELTLTVTLQYSLK